MHAQPFLSARGRPGRSHRRRIISAGLALAGLGALSVVASGSVSASARLGGHPRPIAGNVVANLFEWNWPSVGQRVHPVLGPKGYGGGAGRAAAGLAVSAPADGSTPVLHPWWEVYQPVDYNLTSRMGNEAQFKSMVPPAARPGSRSTSTRSSTT